MALLIPEFADAFMKRWNTPRGRAVMMLAIAQSKCPFCKSGNLPVNGFHEPPMVVIGRTWLASAGCRSADIYRILEKEAEDYAEERRKRLGPWECKGNPWGRDKCWCGKCVRVRLDTYAEREKVR